MNAKIKKGGVIERLLGRVGFIRADRVEGEAETGADDETAADLAKVIPMPKRADPQPVDVRLDLSPRQQLAFLSPYAPGQSPARECFETVKLPRGYSLVTSLFVAPLADASALAWHVAVSAFEPAKTGRKPIKAKAAMKGVMTNRAINILKGVGEVGEAGTWRRKHTQYTLSRRLTDTEEREFKRIHGEKWLSDAAKHMQKGDFTQWEEDDRA